MSDAFRATTLALLTVVLYGVQAAAPPAAHVDAEGLPLPDRAILRLGSARLRHGDMVAQLTISPDGKRVASFAQNQHDVRVWDVATGRLVSRWQGRQRFMPSRLLYAPDGRIAILGDNNGFTLWDPVTDKRVVVGSDLMIPPTTLAFAPNGKRVALANQDGSVKLLDLPSGKEYCNFAAPAVAGMGGPIGLDCLVFSSDGRYLAGSETDGRVRVWDVGLQRDLFSIPSKDGAGRGMGDGLCFVGKDRYLAVCLPGQLALHDAITGKVIEDFKGPGREIRCIGLAEDGSILGICDQGQLCQWEVPSGRERMLAREVQSMANSPSLNSRLVALERQGQIDLLDARTGKRLHPDLTQRTPLAGLRTASKDQLELATETGSLQMWDMPTRKLVRATEPLSKRDDVVRMLAVDQDGKRFVLVDMASGQMSLRVRGDNKPVWQTEIDMSGEMNAWIARFSPDGKVLATCHPRRISLRDAASGKEKQGFTVEGQPQGVAWSGDGRTLAFSEPEDERVTLIELATGQVRRRLTIPDVNLIRFRPDGKGLALASQDGTVRLVSLQLGGKTVELAVGQMPVMAMGYSPDGKLFAASSGSVVRVWDGSGKPLTVLRGHEDAVTGVLFLDRARLATCSIDTTALVWDLRDRADEVIEKANLGQYWHLLASDDCEEAQRAILHLAGQGDEAVKLLASQLSPAQALPEKRVQQWVDDLDADAAATRREALRRLHELDMQAEALLRKSLESARSAEQRRALRRLLDQIEGPCQDRDRLREVRAIEVLELVASPAARKVLAKLADGSDARITREARQALKRLSVTAP